MIAAVVIALLFLLLAIGMPVGFATAFAGAIGLFWVSGWGSALAILKDVPLSVSSENVLATIPMFILMAEFMLRSGIVDDIFETLNAWIGGVKGGLGVVTILTGAGFAAVSGSSTAAAAAMAPTTIPQMVQRGYRESMAAGLCAVVGTLAIMIPPSNGLILYAVIADVSIGKMLIAGIVPGLIATAFLVACLYLILLRHPDWGPANKQHFSWRQRFALLRKVGPMLALVALSIGLIYLGIATATEAGALGAFGAFVILILKRRLTMRALLEALVSTARTSAMITMFIIGATITGYFLTLSQVSQDLVAYLAAAHVSRYAVLAAALGLHLVLGFFMEQISILVLIVPITLPIIVALGFDPIWYGILNTLLAEIGLVMPPIGLNLFVVSRYSKQRLSSIFAGVIPFMIGLVALVFLLVVYPDLSLWLPNRM